jgi:hypothetical protein
VQPPHDGLPADLKFRFGASFEDGHSSKAATALRRATGVQFVAEITKKRQDELSEADELRGDEFLR